MSNDTVTNYSPYNMYQLYGYQYPAFKGAQIRQQSGVTQPVQTLSGVNLNTPPDTVTFSAGNQIQDKGNDKGMSTGMKWLLGIAGTAATIYGCVVAHRAITKPSLEKVAKDFSEIFRRDVSKDEAQKLVNKYKELLNIEDTEEFIQKAFEQVKKDYGYEKVPIKLEINKVKDYLGSGDAAWCSEDGVLTINTLLNGSGKVEAKNMRGRKGLLQNIIHEFQHAKQDEIAYRTSRDDLVEAIFKKKSDKTDMINQVKHLLSKKSRIETEAKKLNITVEECKQRYEHLLKTLEEGNLDFSKIKFDKDTPVALDDLFKDYAKFKEGSAEHSLGLKYIENAKNYIKSGVDRKGYENQILEAEAYGAENKFDEIYNSFASIWRIPFFQ